MIKRKREERNERKRIKDTRVRKKEERKQRRWKK